MLDVLTIKLCLLSKPVTPFVGIEFFIEVSTKIRKTGQKAKFIGTLPKCPRHY